MLTRMSIWRNVAKGSMISIWMWTIGRYVSNRDDRKMDWSGLHIDIFSLSVTYWRYQDFYNFPLQFLTTFYFYSSKIREEDYRQIQTNVPFLAPEILAVFANSQIFHDNQPTKSLAIVHQRPAIHDDPKKHTRNDSDSEKKLLKRLEGNNFDWIQIQPKN